jgi:hypothetical protein
MLKLIETGSHNGFTATAIDMSGSTVQYSYRVWNPYEISQAH